MIDSVAALDVNMRIQSHFNCDIKLILDEKYSVSASNNADDQCVVLQSLNIGKSNRMPIIGFETFGNVMLTGTFGKAANNADFAHILNCTDGSTVVLKSFKNRSFAFLGQNPFNERVTIGCGDRIFAKIEFVDGNARINEEILFDGRAFQQISNAFAPLDNFHKSSFCHIDLNQGHTIKELRLSLRLSRYLTLLFNGNCLFAVRFDGTGFSKSMHILKASYNLVGTINVEPLNDVVDNGAQAVLKVKTFGSFTRTGNFDHIANMEGFTAQVISNREFGIFGDSFDNKIISIGRLRRVLATVKFQNGIITINEDMKFDGRTFSSTLPRFPRPLMSPSPFMHIQLDTNGDHDIAEIAIVMRDHPYLHFFFTYTSLLLGSFNGIETRQAIEGEIYG